MNEKADSIDTTESLRLQIENEKLKNEQTRTFFEQWRLDVLPAHEDRLVSREQAYAFAKVGIQMLFLLNGGALIAFPAFAKLVGAGFTEHMGWALLSIASFVFGLVLIVLTVLLAYLSMRADADAVSNKEEYLKLGLHSLAAPDKDKSKYDKMQMDAETVRSRDYDNATRLAKWALGLTIGSLVAFVFGTFCAGWVLSANPASSASVRPPSTVAPITAPAEQN